MKKYLLLFLSILLLAVLAACGSGGVSGKEVKQVKIGVNGADAIYWDVIKKKAKKKGINIQLVTFSDYILPNKALAHGEIDMNCFQHLAFLSQFNVAHHLDIVPIGSTSIGPTGLYSKKYRKISEIPKGSKIAISDDPANLGRGLNLLASKGVITLKDGVGIYPTPDDIVKNPKNLKFIQMKSQQTARVLPDVAASLINSGIAGKAGLGFDDALALDDPHSKSSRPYIGVFAVRHGDQDNQTYRTVAKLFQTPEVKKAVKKDSKGGRIVVDIPVKELQKTLDQLMANIKAKKK